MTQPLRVGGVPEHFNTPFYRAAERDLFADAPFDYSFTEYFGGTGQMLAALDAGELDVAVLLTEGVVTHIAKGGDATILGTYVTSPLVWGVHVHAEAPYASIEELRGQPFAISRPRSGSHIMAYVLAADHGWDPRSEMSFEQVGDLAGARTALAEGRGTAFMWEKFTTKPVVDSGEWRRVGTCATPWAPFVIVSRRDFARERADDLNTLFATLQTLTAEMTQEPEATIAEVVSRFGQRPEDAAAWLEQTTWAERPGIDQPDLSRVIDTLTDVGVLDAPLAPEEVLFPR
ncbi:PhnD/SsuA/transferrin family substrate-binding protein [Lujinxingia vulgaris]|uniref:PhnD/SsuA/transferrin family substrate-binding protein n=1 Tax=Lujinxingia vulgaris TaxID=2600176 RepID=A0A5C6XER1_9DELT|nr:PhnD/SsuA/transferrin family substrate-binding protein [Lujinxingia vulgaris]TXD37323.1 PhnD/SsuA/transferrin family substrate-binding protein [Lujinxingia vulgaris]